MWLSKTDIRLRVGDTARSAVFYEALLGAPPAHRTATSATFEFDSPPLVLTVEYRLRVRRSGDRRSAVGTGDRFALVVAEAQHVGDAAIRLRRAGVRLRIEDQGIEAHDPDGNAWRVRFGSSAPGQSIVQRETRAERHGDERD